MKVKSIANKQQKKAFDRVVKAIKAAQAKGLVFYGKQDSLVAYTEAADNYMDENGLHSLGGEGTAIQHLSSSVLQDSGADDYPRYLKPEHNPEYDPEFE